MGVMGLMVLAFMGYQWYLISTTGQSLAKRWMGIKIVRIDGTPVNFVNGVILRSWVMAPARQHPGARPDRQPRQSADDLRRGAPLPA